MPARPTLPPPLRLQGKNLVRAGRRNLLYFAGCDYLGLGSHPRVVRALSRTALAQGTGVAASRATTGNHPLHLELEQQLAKFFQTPAATILPSGYAADLAATQALAGQFTHAFIDERAHSALQDAATFLGPLTRVVTFLHRDAADLARQTRRLGKAARILVLTDGMFAFDGSLAPLREYFSILPRHALLLVDDAQAAGVLGEHGRGSPEHWGLNAAEHRRLIRVISLSKAFGAGGGAILGDQTMRDAVVARSRVFSGSTPLAPHLAAAALVGLRLASDPSLRHRLWEHVALVRAALHGTGQPAAEPSPSPIVALYPRSPQAAAALIKLLKQSGIFPSFIHYAGGPPNGFLRLALSSSHSTQQVNRLAQALERHFCA